MSRLQVIFWLLFAITASAQDEAGRPVILSFTPEEYHAHEQNWDVLQDDTGLIYIANGDAILQYDGVNWRKLELPDLNRICRLAADDGNKIYVGADGEFGYLDTDNTSFIKYVSLLEYIPEEFRHLKDVWEIFVDSGNIIFRSGNNIYEWDGSQMHVYVSPYTLQLAFQQGGTIYLTAPAEGLLTFSDGTFTRLAQSDVLKRSDVIAILPYEGNTSLIATRKSGIFLYDGQTFTPFKNEVEAYLKEELVYKGIRYNGVYLFATLNGGILMMDKYGGLIKKITKEDGLLDNQIYSIAMDNQSGLWVCSLSGISRIELFRPYTVYDIKDGLDQRIWDIKRHNGRLYAGNSYGLHVMEKNAAGGMVFKPAAGLRTIVWSLLTVGGDLLAGAEDGVYLIKEKEALKITGHSVNILYQSRTDPNRVFVAHPNGLSSIYCGAEGWKMEAEASGIRQNVLSIAQQENGDLWLGTRTNGVLRLNAGRDGNWGKDSPPVIYGPDKGVNPGWSRVYIADTLVRIRTDCEINDDCFSYLDEAEDRFKPDLSFDALLDRNLEVVPTGYEADRHFLLREKHTTGRYFSVGNNENGQKAVHEIRLGSFERDVGNSVYWDDNSTIWLGGEALVRYDLKMHTQPPVTFPTYVRSVSTTNDSLIFAGLNGENASPMPPGHNFLRFDFATPSFDFGSRNAYQYKLEGFDDDWSPWSYETRKDYTNLPPGAYNFKVRSKNPFGEEGLEGFYSFEISTPWYSSWGAYLGYLLLFAMLLWGSVRWRARQLRRENAALERVVAMRTSEVRHQANQLKIQAEKLLELDRAKSRFFANISHEFRTPLTLIKGPIEQLERDGYEPLSRENVKMIRRNANRLLHMVNQLLDLARIDEGSLQLTPTEGDVYKCLRAAAASFNSHAAQRNMDYNVDIPASVFWASFDRDKLQNIVYNLLGNAFKFSEDGDTVTFTASCGNGELYMEVGDSGKGIPAGKLPHIFERFYQADTSATKEKEGSGIGLSLSRDLVELMKGRITARSEEGKGSSFVVRLPLEEIRTRRPGTAGAVQDIKEPEALPAITWPSPAPADQARVLVVEDNADMRHFIREQLTPHFRVMEAVNGAEGYERALKIGPDLIISDLMMPKMDGIELCRKLKTELATSHIPVIMLTAKAGLENKIEGLETGADDYLTKPFSSRELLTRARNLIGQRRRLRDYYSRQEMEINPGAVAVTSVDQRFLEKLLNLLESHYQESEFGVPQLQKALAMSKTQLHRKIKALTNASPGELLRHFRLKRAAQLLLEKEDSVTQIAYKVGFNNLSYFAKCFRELYGAPPSSFDT